jgi:hypothetical protein
MVVALAVTKAITNLQEAHQKLGVAPAVSNNFFTEWRGQFPELNSTEITHLDRLKQRYVEYADNGSITEGTVNLILLSPLLDLIGLLDSPYQIRGEKYVRFELEDGETRLDGLIDALIVQDNLWLVVIESKRYGFSVRQALAQTLAYLVSSNVSPAFGLITTGEDYLFVKLDLQSKQYALSDKFTLTTAAGNELHAVAKILKQLVTKA